MNLTSVANSLYNTFIYDPKVATGATPANVALTLVGSAIAYRILQKNEYVPENESLRIPKATACVFTARSIVQGNVFDTLLSGIALATVSYWESWQLRVTLQNVETKLNQLEKDIISALQKGDFNSRKNFFVRRFNKIQAALAENTARIPRNCMKNAARRMIQIRDLLDIQGLKREIDQAFDQGTFLQNRSDFLGRVKALWNANIRPSQEEISDLQEMNKKVHSSLIQRTVRRLPNLFSQQVSNANILGFLDYTELARTEAVSPAWYRAVNFTDACWRTQYHRIAQNDVQPRDTPYKQFTRDFFLTAFARDFYKNYFGVDIDEVPRIPPQLAEKADALIFVPEYVTMTLDENSILGLDQNGMLTENPALYHNRPQAVEGKRVLRVPVTLNNLTILTRTHLKMGIPINRGTAISMRAWGDVFRQNGNAHFPSHWSGQKRELIGKGLNFAEQQAAVKQKRLEVVPLLDRVIFNLFTHVRSGEFVDVRCNCARTATVVRDRNNNPRQAKVFSYHSLEFGEPILTLLVPALSPDDRVTGVAVGVPLEALDS